MIKFRLSTKNISKENVDTYIFFVRKNFKLSKIKDIYPDIELVAKKRDFSGELNSKLIIPLKLNGKFKNLILIGLGEKIKIEGFRRVIGMIPKLAETLNFESAALILPDEKNIEYLIKESVIILNMAKYKFNEFITTLKNKKRILKIVFLVNSDKNLKKIIENAVIISEAVNLSRHWIDLPANILGPAQLVEEAKKIAKENNLKINVFNEKKLKELGMGGLAGVASGSGKDAQLVILEYQASEKTPLIGLVGKGITFDSGGLSLKPAIAMETMKDDMSGASAVLGVMKALGKLKPKVNVVAVVPLAENLPGHNPLMPGDIIRFYNGKTAEISNTDAEGRLILADALAYIVKNYNLDVLIDLATLTGACMHALGPFFSGLFSNNAKLIKKICSAAEASGERVWRLPLDEDYKPAIKSDVADMLNIGRHPYYAGATTAALFLQNFVEKVNWAHLDIAGTAFNVPGINYLGKGATGVGVRLLVEFIMNYE